MASQKGVAGYDNLVPETEAYFRKHPRKKSEQEKKQEKKKRETFQVCINSLLACYFFDNVVFSVFRRRWRRIPRTWSD